MRKITLFLAALLCGIAPLLAQISFADRVIVDETLRADGAWGVHLADLDGDGDPDLVSGSINDNKVAWYENIGGQGIFPTQHILSENAEEVRAVTTADLDGDGDLDIISASFEDDKIAWYENLNGNGDFSTERIIVDNPGQIFGPNTIYAVDLDLDGDADLLTSSFFDNRLSWIENLDGAGNFGTPNIITSNLTFAGFTYPADLDGDGDPDVLGVSSNNGNLIWYENLDGQGSFSNGLGITTSANLPQETFAADLDGDGDLDVLLTSTGDDRVAWYENLDGQGDFGPRQTLTTSLNGALSVVAADLDNDGDADVVATSQFDDEIVWFENLNGQGDFGGEQLIPTDLTDVRTLAVGDVDGDGDLDLFSAASGDDDISWYRNTDGEGTFSSPIRVTKSVSSPRSVSIADLNNDGDLDVLSASFADNRIAWHRNVTGNGVTGWDQIDLDAAAGDARFVRQADLDGDNDQDVLAAYGNRVVWYENLDAGQAFGAAREISDDVLGVRVVRAADFDGDGDRDAVSLSVTDDKVAWYENLDGQGTFGSEQVLAADFSFSESLIIADLDGDGDADIVYTDRDGDKIVWHENTDGQGAFGGALVVNAAVDGVSTVYAADLDGDGDLDLAASSANATQVVWFANTDGNGTFGPGNLVGILTGVPTAVLAQDLDGDGDADLVVSNTSDDELVYFENVDGSGTFGPEQLISTSIDGGVALTGGDVDGDGDLDIVSCGTLSNQITWHENLSPTTNQLTGIVRFDAAGDGCDAEDSAVEYLMVTTNDGTATLSTFTNENGVYQLLPTVGTYVTAPVPPDGFTVTPAEYTATFSDLGNEASGDFCVQAVQPIQDLSVSLYPLREARPGFELIYRLVYRNLGSAPASGTVVLLYEDVSVIFMSASETVSEQTAGMITFDYAQLAPFESRFIDLTFSVYSSPQVEIDDLLKFNGFVNPTAGDEYPEDNVFNYRQTVVGSFDPNDITVMEGPFIEESQVEDYLHYLIRFQNTGTASAVNVRIENILESQLDPGTLVVESSSHPMRAELNDDHELVFFFDGINLPDSTANEPLSHGHVAYRIRPRPGLDWHDIIFNDAAIFFDFNPPIFTNTVSTEVIPPVNVSEAEAEAGFRVYPNPTTGQLNIVAAEPIARVELYDARGRRLLEARTTTLDVAWLPAGTYFCRLIDERGRTGVRTVVVRR